MRNGNGLWIKDIEVRLENFVAGWTPDGKQLERVNPNYISNEILYFYDIEELKAFADFINYAVHKEEILRKDKETT